MIKGICPECGFQGEVIAFFVEGDARQAIAEACRLPPEIGALAVRYLGLFRPPARALSLSKAARLLRELVDAIEAGVVRRRGRDWRAPVAAWKTAIETMLDARERLTLPLNNHHYLYEIVAGQANQAEGAIEHQVESIRRRGQHREASALDAPADPVQARELLQGALAKLRGEQRDE